MSNDSQNHNDQESNLISYTETQNLHPLDEKIDYINFIKSIADTFKLTNPSSITNDNYPVIIKFLEGIENLRRAKIYQYKLFESIMDYVCEEFTYLLRYCNNKAILVNGFILVKEIFSNYEFNYVNNWIERLFEAVLIYKDSSDLQLNKISKECLDLFTKNMCYTESIEVLIKQIVNENEATAEYCLKLLLDLINFTELNQLENFCFNEICESFNEIQNLYESNRILMVSKVFNEIRFKLNDKFKIMLENLTEENKNYIVSLINLSRN